MSSSYANFCDDKQIHTEVGTTHFSQCMNPRSVRDIRNFLLQHANPETMECCYYNSYGGYSFVPSMALDVTESITIAVDVRTTKD